MKIRKELFAAALIVPGLILAQSSGAGQSSGSGQSSGTSGQSQGSKKGHQGSTATGDQTGTAGTRSGSASLNSNERSFLMTAAEEGQHEVEMSQMAAQKATDPQVKTFAQRMVDDHSRANQELMSLMQQKGLSSSNNMGEKHKNQTDPLSKMSGADFDRAFMRNQVQHHEKDVRQFEQESKRATDPDVRAWAEKMLPILREHLQQAQTVSQSVTGSKGSGNAKKSGI